MKVRFTTDVELEVVETFDDDNDIYESHYEVFSEGDETELDIVGHPLKFRCNEWMADLEHVNVQFANGNVAFGVGADWFEKVKND